MLIGVGEAGPERVDCADGRRARGRRGDGGTCAAGMRATGREGDTYNITVNTNATSGTYLADLQMARALAW